MKSHYDSRNDCSNSGFISTENIIHIVAEAAKTRNEFGGFITAGWERLHSAQVIFNNQTVMTHILRLMSE
ncbi:hypothetical Protein YC6258_00976 [Gynuella sunshinyii YC6258]|uniref:Uncharacterized protein n=1 Tax=Gynuella sunshinyii YC6258 TaxID=1445510 RepID=A0A0C5VFR0_9GAMM|nr:hypothetical Protein YC6258_00976 [Gynuella sunshinyii YC6258]